ncbi:MAG: hypothetical protein AAF842_11995 [Planctomycetota bacterium]
MPLNPLTSIDRSIDDLRIFSRRLHRGWESLEDLLHGLALEVPIVTDVGRMVFAPGGDLPIDDLDGIALGYLPLDGKWQLGVGIGPADADPLSPAWKWRSRENWDQQMSLAGAMAVEWFVYDIERTVRDTTAEVESAAGSVLEATHRLRSRLPDESD